MRLSDIPLDRPVATLMVLLCVTVLGTVSVFYLPLGFMPVVKEPVRTASRPAKRTATPTVDPTPVWSPDR